MKVYHKVTSQSIVQTLLHPGLPQKQEMPSSQGLKPQPASRQLALNLNTLGTPLPLAL